MDWAAEEVILKINKHWKGPLRAPWETSTDPGTSSEVMEECWLLVCSSMPTVQFLLPGSCSGLPSVMNCFYLGVSRLNNPIPPQIDFHHNNRKLRNWLEEYKTACVSERIMMAFELWVEMMSSVHSSVVCSLDAWKVRLSSAMKPWRPGLTVWHFGLRIYSFSQMGLKNWL